MATGALLVNSFKNDFDAVSGKKFKNLNCARSFLLLQISTSSKALLTAQTSYES